MLIYNYFMLIYNYFILVTIYVILTAITFTLTITYLSFKLYSVVVISSRILSLICMFI